MKGKELLDLFYNDINYQSETIEILLHDVNRLSNNSTWKAGHSETAPA